MQQQQNQQVMFWVLIRLATTTESNINFALARLESFYQTQYMRKLIWSINLTELSKHVEKIRWSINPTELEYISIY